MTSSWLCQIWTSYIRYCGQWGRRKDWQMAPYNTLPTERVESKKKRSRWTQPEPWKKFFYCVVIFCITNIETSKTLNSHNTDIDNCLFQVRYIYLHVHCQYHTIHTLLWKPGTAPRVCKTHVCTHRQSKTLNCYPDDTKQLPEPVLTSDQWHRQWH